MKSRSSIIFVEVVQPLSKFAKVSNWVTSYEQRDFARFGLDLDKKNTYELLNLRALKILPVNNTHIFQYMGKVFCAHVEFQ